MKFGRAYTVTMSVLAAFAAMTLVGGVRGGGALFAIGFVAIAMVLPVSLVLSHLRREVLGNYRQGARDRTGMPVDVPRILRSRRVVGRGFFGAMIALGVPVLAITALLFVALPRVSTGGFGLLGLEGGPRVRYGDSIELRGEGALVPDPSVALRFTIDDAPAALPRAMPLRFRGATLDDFDGRRWRRSEEKGVVPERTATGRAIRIERAAFAPGGLVVPDGTIAVSSLERAGETSMTYVAWVGPSSDDVQKTGGPSAAVRARALATPEGFSPRLRALAHTWTEGATTDAAKAAAIERTLKTTFAYDLASPARSADDPLSDFVFEKRRGHCELFATTMALMLREVGVPARIVTGFVGGTLNPFGGFYTVRQADSHAWVEALVGDRWTTFDPTPTGPRAASTGLVASADDLGDALAHRWAPSMLDFDAKARATLLSRPRVVVVGLGALVVMLLVETLLRARLRDATHDLRRLVAKIAPARAGDRDPGTKATALYATLERALAEHGITREASTPPLAHAEALARRGHPLAAEILALTRIYLELRFGMRPLARTDEASFRKRVAALRSP